MHRLAFCEVHLELSNKSPVFAATAQFSLAFVPPFETTMFLHASKWLAGCWNLSVFAGSCKQRAKYDKYSLSCSLHNSLHCLQILLLVKRPQSHKWTGITSILSFLLLTISRGCLAHQAKQHTVLSTWVASKEIFQYAMDLKLPNLVLKQIQIFLKT